MFQLLKKNNIFDLDDLSEYLNKHLKSKSKLNGNVQFFENQSNGSDSKFDLDSDDDDEKGSM
jgi:hypothetical protein